MNGRRVFFTVQDAGGVLNELQQTLFVPTRLPFALGEGLELGLRLPRVSRSLDVPVVVIGRRLPRPGSLLSAGIVVRLSDINHPAVELLRDAVNPNIVDLEARIQERLRLPATLAYERFEDAASELTSMLDDGAMVHLDDQFTRGDRLSLLVTVDGLEALRTNVIVRRLHMHRTEDQVVLQALDDAARREIEAFLTTPRVQSQRA